MMDFHCSDAGHKACGYVARGNSEDDVLKQVKQHAQQVHQPWSPDAETKVRSLIHDESSDAHKKSMQH